MKGFFIDIDNNLLEPKHYWAIKDSIWLFMWFIDKITTIDLEQIGWVLGGKPIKWIDTYKELGLPERTYNRWLARLKKYNYIIIIRTPYGLKIGVKKAKKRFGKRVDKLFTNQNRYAKSGITDTPKVAGHYTKNGGSNIRQYQLDNNSKDITNVKNNKLFSLRNGLNELKTKMRMPQ